ncbi:MAG: hypothetical protein WCN92_12105 [Eubacteriales bacterium]
MGLEGVPPLFFKKNMEKNFSIKKISNNIYRIEEPWFKEHANLYLFKGKKFDLLIDCGLGIFNLKEFLNNKIFNSRINFTVFCTKNTMRININYFRQKQGTHEMRSLLGNLFF